MQNLEIVRNDDGRTLTDRNGKVRGEFRQMNPLGNIVMKKVTFRCDRHGDVPCEVAVVHGTETFAYCPICEREEEKRKELEEEQRRRERERKALVDRYREMNIEPEYWGKTLDCYEPKCDSQREAKAAVARLIERSRGKVVLLGSNGCGKTHLGVCAVKDLGGRVLTMYEITTMIRQSYSALAERTELDIVGELATVPMLFIDEMGRTKGSAAELNWLSYILDKRHQRDLPFMLASNSHRMKDCPNGKRHCEQCFENFLGNDIISRLMEDTEIVTMRDAPDYRRINRQ